MKILDLCNGTVHTYGSNKHDSLRISEDGHYLTYCNLQCGESSGEGGSYRFVMEDNKIPMDSQTEEALHCESYFNIGGFDKKAKVDKRIIKIAEHYGKDSQLNILQEECSELIQAVSKYRRSNDLKVFNKMHIEEEIADVEIMISQIKHLLEISERDIKAMKDIKLERQLDRIKEEN